DQIEAMAMGDRIVVMSAAVVQQVGTPAEVYHDPANLFVARFIGSPGMNLVPGEYRDGVVHLPCGPYAAPDDWKPALDRSLDADGTVILGFRPEAVTVTDEGTAGDLPATVYATDLHGSYTMLHLDLCDGQVIQARASRETHYAINTPTTFDLNPAMVRFFHPKTEHTIMKEAGA
ncbi:MAG: ABC transporter ATP-binding protein, partial [Anaerolineae bacterium]|nr:ABC transporter ATP-binding protein [Anaerolineae bacterium]